LLFQRSNLKKNFNQHFEDLQNDTNMFIMSVIHIPKKIKRTHLVAEPDRA